MNWIFSLQNILNAFLYRNLAKKPQLFTLFKEENKWALLYFFIFKGIFSKWEFYRNKWRCLHPLCLTIVMFFCCLQVSISSWHDPLYVTPSEPHTSAPSSSAHVPTGQTHSKFNGSFSTHSAPNLQSSALQILSPRTKMMMVMKNV